LARLALDAAVGDLHLDPKQHVAQVAAQRLVRVRDRVRVRG